MDYLVSHISEILNRLGKARKLCRRIGKGTIMEDLNGFDERCCIPIPFFTMEFPDWYCAGSFSNTEATKKSRSRSDADPRKIMALIKCTDMKGTGLVVSKWSNFSPTRLL